MKERESKREFTNTYFIIFVFYGRKILLLEFLLQFHHLPIPPWTPRRHP